MQYSGQDLLWLIGSLSRIFRIPFNSNQILSLEEGDCVMQKLNAKLTPLTCECAGDDALFAAAANDAVFEMRRIA